MYNLLKVVDLIGIIYYKFKIFYLLYFLIFFYSIIRGELSFGFQVTHDLYLFDELPVYYSIMINYHI